MMQLSAWDWVSDGPVASIMEKRPGRGVATGQLLLTPGQVAFNAMCDRAAALVFPDMCNGAAAQDAVDAVFDDEVWSRQMTELQRLSDGVKTPHRPETLSRRFPWTQRLGLSPPTLKVAQDCLKALTWVYLAHDNMARAEFRLSASTPKEIQENDHLWFLTDPVVPLALGRGLLAFRRGSVALAATYPATATGPNVDTFRHVLTLLRLTTSSFREYLGVLANIPEAAVTAVSPDVSDLTTSSPSVLEVFREALRDGGGADEFA